MEKDGLLKLYRKRYKNLAHQSAHTSLNSNSNKMYKFYKKEGSIMQNKYKNGLISKEKFKAWIDSTMLRKK